MTTPFQPFQFSPERSTSTKKAEEDALRYIQDMKKDLGLETDEVSTLILLEIITFVQKLRGMDSCGCLPPKIAEELDVVTMDLAMIQLLLRGAELYDDTKFPKVVAAIRANMLTLPQRFLEGKSTTTDVIYFSRPRFWPTLLNLGGDVILQTFQRMWKRKS